MKFWILDCRFSIGESKSKKVFCFALWALLLALSVPAEAQQQVKVHRSGGSHPVRLLQPISGHFYEIYRKLGYVEGENIAIEYRFAEGKLERLTDLAAELVRLKG